MSLRKTPFVPGEFYHLYNRGVDRRKIFLSKEDHERFLALLYVCNGSVTVDLKLQGKTLYEVSAIERGETLVDVCCYCLMPNHFHILVKEKVEGGISRFMQKLTTAYTMYINKRVKRTGALFGGKFKATHVPDDRYLKHLISYIHLNPIKLIESKWKEVGILNNTRAEKFLTSFKYSSFIDYSNVSRPENILLNKNNLLDTTDVPTDFNESILEWLSKSP
jgi:putative transposase